MRFCSSKRWIGEGVDNRRFNYFLGAQDFILSDAKMAGGIYSYLDIAEVKLEN
jgi:hypothetical protein